MAYGRQYALRRTAVALAAGCAILGAPATAHAQARSVLAYAGAEERASSRVSASAPTGPQGMRPGAASTAGPDGGATGAPDPEPATEPTGPDDDPGPAPSGSADDPATPPADPTGPAPATEGSPDAVPPDAPPGHHAPRERTTPPDTARQGGPAPAAVPAGDGRAAPVPSPAGALDVTPRTAAPGPQAQVLPDADSPDRVPEAGSEPRMGILEAAHQPAPSPADPGALGTRLILAGVGGLLVSIGGLITIAIRRRQW